MMMTLFDDEQIYRAFVHDIKKETAKEVARNKAIFMIKKGKIGLDEIGEYFPELSVEDREEIKASILQQA